MNLTTLDSGSPAFAGVRNDGSCQPATGAAVPSICTRMPRIQRADQVISRQRMPFNWCGLPAMSIPCSLHSNGSPFGLQLTAARFQDFKLLAVAKVAEALIGFDTVPPILKTATAVA